MHPARLLDAVVVMTAQLHPMIRVILRPVLYPFIQWRLKGIAVTLDREYKWLPATTWDAVEKHGQNAVLCIKQQSDVFTKEKEVIGICALDYKNKTVRTVLDIPKKYHKTGTTF